MQLFSKQKPSQGKFLRNRIASQKIWPISKLGLKRLRLDNRYSILEDRFTVVIVIER